MRKNKGWWSCRALTSLRHQRCASLLTQTWSHRYSMRGTRILTTISLRRNKWYIKWCKKENTQAPQASRALLLKILSALRQSAEAERDSVKRKPRRRKRNSLFWRSKTSSVSLRLRSRTSAPFWRTWFELGGVRQESTESTNSHRETPLFLPCHLRFLFRHLKPQHYCQFFRKYLCHWWKKKDHLCFSIHLHILWTGFHLTSIAWSAASTSAPQNRNSGSRIFSSIANKRVRAETLFQYMP